MWWKRHKWKVLAPIAAAAALAVAFCLEGDVPDRGGVGTPQPTAAVSAPAPTASSAAAVPASPAPEESGAPTPAPAQTPAPTPEAAPTDYPGGAEAGGPPRENGQPVSAPAEEGVPAGDGAAAAPGPGSVMGAQMGEGRDTPEGKPAAIEPETVTISDVAHTCTLSISCAVLLEKPEGLDSEKEELVPGDGWVLPPTEVTFYEGESVFNVLQRTCKQNKIHMEYSNTPMYHSAYIEGIHNLYELDCGELSGWMYQVNDWFPNYGCSRYALREGDVVCWVYTCDLGADVGDLLSGGN